MPGPLAIANNLPESDPARTGSTHEDPPMESDEDFAERIKTLVDTERKAAVDFRNLQKRAAEAKPATPEPAQGDPSLHPIYEIQKLARELEMAISKTASYKNSDIEKTLVHLKTAVHGIIDALPGSVKPSKVAA